MLLITDTFTFCHECHRHNIPVIRLGDIDSQGYHDQESGADLCVDCLRKALSMLEEPAATEWRPMDGENYPRDPNQKIQMIVNGYCVEREEWQTDIGQEIRAPYRCIRGWRPIDPPAPA